MNRIRKEVHQKIENAFNFMKKIPLKFTRNKKNITSEIMPKKYNTTKVKLGTIFEKSQRSRVILKIIGATPKFKTHNKVVRIICFYIYTIVYLRIEFYMSEIEKKN